MENRIDLMNLSFIQLFELKDLDISRYSISDNAYYWHIPDEITMLPTKMLPTKILVQKVLLFLRPSYFRLPYD